jgi:hypothetical protein
MLDGVEVLGRVLILGGITAADVPARQANPQVHPSVPGLDAIVTNMVRRLEILYRFDVIAIVHTSYPD